MATSIPGEDWKTYDQFAHGIDTYRLPGSDRSGTDLTVRLDGGPALQIAFLDAHQARWSAAGDGWENAGGTDEYDAVAIDDRAVFLDLNPASRPRESLTLVFSPRTGRALAVHSQIAAEPEPGVPQVRQTFWTGSTGDVAPSGEPPAPTRDLIGRRNLYRYSPEHLYEHVYLNSERYVWQCLQGVQRGHGDCDLATTYKFDDDLYLFTFREFRIPVASVWLHDFAGMHTTGKFLGLRGDGQAEASRGGGRIIPLGAVSYPDDAPPV